MNNIIRKSIYILLYIGIIAGFIYIGSKEYKVKSYDNDQEKFSEEYKGIPKDNVFEYLSTSELLNILNDGTGIIFIGDKDNDWSNEYAKQLYKLSKTNDIEKIYYYDAKQIKTLKNSNYYKVLNALKGNLASTDMSDDNLFTPSLYIVDSGEVTFSDMTSAVVKNNETIESFWTKEKVEDFEQRLLIAMAIDIDNK